MSGPRPGSRRRLARGLAAAGLALGLALAPLTAGPGEVAAALVTVENDKFFAGTDRHYTQGLRVQLSFRRGNTGPLERHVAALLQKLPGQPALDEAKATFSLGQDIFTPENTDTTAVVTGDRPYAGWLYLGTGYQVVLDGRRSVTTELTYGLVGPNALGRQAQNGWHEVIHVPRAEGWHHQLRNEPGVNLATDWRWRFRTRHVDFIPRAGLALGNIRTHATVGAALRLGLRLPDDFGADLIRPGSPASESAPARFGAYFFVNGEARAVARDIFLDGNTWRDSHSVRKRPVVADLAAGFSIRGPARMLGARGWTLTYAQNYRTKEFHGQPRRNVFGSVSFGLLY